MPKKGEHIYKRKDGRWEGRYRCGVDDNGKTFYRSVYGKSCSEVREKLSERTDTGRDESTKKKNDLLFRDAVALWKKTNKTRFKGATEMKYDFLLATHILPELGNCKLCDFGTVLLADFMNKKLQSGRIDRKGGLSPSYVRTIMLIVKEVIATAVNEDLCPPVKSNIRNPSPSKKELSVLTARSQAQLEQVLISQPNGTNIGILLSLYTGLRISEVCALKWSDIDLQNNILHVRSTVARVKDSENGHATRLVIDTPKTKSSRRDIPIAKHLSEMLRSLFEKRRSEYVISENEGFVSPRTFEYRFHRVVEKSGLRQFNYHTLRHTFATRCVELGVDVKTLSEILGHANVSVTLNTYVHSSMERKREQLEKLTNLSA